MDKNTNKIGGARNLMFLAKGCKCQCNQNVVIGKFILNLGSQS
jgi:hypothetical protein